MREVELSVCSAPESEDEFSLSAPTSRGVSREEFQLPPTHEEEDEEEVEEEEDEEDSEDDSAFEDRVGEEEGDAGEEFDKIDLEGGNFTDSKDESPVQISGQGLGCEEDQDKRFGNSIYMQRALLAVKTAWRVYLMGIGRD